MAERPLYWILAYDIRCPKRLTKMCKCMKNHGLHVQKSVFYITATRREMDDIIEDARSIMDEDVDDVRVYGCCAMEKAEVLGQPYLEGGFLLI
ncbi:MAG: CRISPR-associated endonuclease Cas2 [Hahellaceae bacterium]|nr:CRISPR-associated endonuclease Cas2 [Hahellaceae bacterium]